MKIIVINDFGESQIQKIADFLVEQEYKDSEHIYKAKVRKKAAKGEKISEVKS